MTTTDPPPLHNKPAHIRIIRNPRNPVFQPTWRGMAVPPPAVAGGRSDPAGNAFRQWLALLILNLGVDQFEGTSQAHRMLKPIGYSGMVEVSWFPSYRRHEPGMPWGSSPTTRFQHRSFQPDTVDSSLMRGRTSWSMRIGFRPLSATTVDGLKAASAAAGSTSSSLARGWCEREKWRNAKGALCRASARAALPGFAASLDLVLPAPKPHECGISHVRLKGIGESNSCVKSCLISTF